MTEMVLSALTWAVMIATIIALWGVTMWALYRSLHDEERKINLLDKQGEIDTYSPRALAELREWIQSNPNDPFAEQARQRHNECVEILQRVDERFYDWDEREIQSLEEL
jgi:hypothetical protein